MANAREIEVELVLYIDGEEVSTRRETVRSSNDLFRQDFWGVVEKDISDFKGRVAAHEYEEPPF